MTNGPKQHLIRDLPKLGMNLPKEGTGIIEGWGGLTVRNSKYEI